MTTTEKQIELIKYIQTEIPEILDLKFGCGVCWKHRGEDEKKGTIIKIDWGSDFCSFRTISGYIQSKEVITKIIGRPITLSDVLRVIGKKEIDFDIYIDTNFLIYLAKKDTEKLFFPAKTKWEQEKDFNNQSEEFYSFLHDLLITK